MPELQTFLADVFHPHSLTLVVSSLLLAVFASYVSLELAERIKESTGTSRISWLSFAAISMGGGIWSMHFVAMLGLMLPFPVTFDLPLTLASLGLAIAVSGCGFYFAFRQKTSSTRFLLGGAVMGIGVAAMHYLGMAAMQLPASVSYDYLLVAISVVIAVAASTIALALAFSVHSISLKLLSALAMGLAVFGMHFTGMAAFICGPAGELAALPGIAAHTLAGPVILASSLKGTVSVDSERGQGTTFTVTLPIAA